MSLLQKRPGLPDALRKDDVSQTIEKMVSAYFGRSWKINEAWDMIEYASHPAALVSDGRNSAFVKYSAASDGRQQFECEAAGLRLLSERAGVLTPTIVGIQDVTGGCVMIQEAVQEVPRGEKEWRDIGRTLAYIHQVKGERFGLETDGYFGSLPQDNVPMESWSEFFIERRLKAGLKLAVDSGNLPIDLARNVEKLLARVPELSGLECEKTLLHGDAQINNFISTEKGAVVIDPAIYYGNREMDLAHLDFFQEMPPTVFKGYKEMLPIPPGFMERRELWRVWGYLACVACEGKDYVGLLRNAVEKYL